MHIRTVRKPQAKPPVYAVRYKTWREANFTEFRGTHARRPHSREEALWWGKALARTLSGRGCQAEVREDDRVIAYWTRVEGWQEVT